MSNQRSQNNKYKKQELQNNGVKYMIIIAAVIAVVFLAIKFWPDSDDSTQVSAAVQPGVAYLKTLEARNVTDIENQIKQVERQERYEAYANGDISIYERFADTIIMGDSRAEGLIDYEILDPRNVICERGDTIYAIEDHISELINFNPEYLFLTYGMNDLLYHAGDSQLFKSRYKEILSNLQTQLPNTTIVLNSILPVEEFALEQNQYFGYWQDFNQAVEELAQEDGYLYVDNTEIAYAHEELYESDGIHVQYSFYEYWLTNMIFEVDENL